MNEHWLKHYGTHGEFFVQPGDEVYAGQIIGENDTRGQDLGINLCKKREAEGGFRANAIDAAKKRGKSFTSRPMSFESAIAWVHPIEVVTVTPQSIRLRRPNFNGKSMNRNK